MTLAADRSTPSSAQPELEFSYEIPDALKAKLTEMHQKTYGELYEPAPPDATPLEEDIAEVLALLQQDDPQLGHLRLVWMALILAIAVEPTLKYYQPDITIPKQTITALTSYLSASTSKPNSPNLDNVNELVLEIKRSTAKEIFSLQTLYEAVAIYQYVLKTLNFEQAPNAVLDILENCLEGYAISSNSEKRRELYKWWLIDVCPASCNLVSVKNWINEIEENTKEEIYCMDFPDEIYLSGSINNMGITYLFDAPLLIISDRFIPISEKSEREDFHFKRRYIVGEYEISIDELFDFNVNNFANDLFLVADHENDIYHPLRSVAIATYPGELRCEAYLYHYIGDWEKDLEDLRIIKFLEILGRDVEQRIECIFKGASIKEQYYFTTIAFNVSGSTTIGESINALSQALAACHKEISRTYRNITGLSELFTFPPALRHTYAQYLMYFGQFLEDLGINADTSVTDIDSKLVLKVQPKDSEEALENIHLALAAYLSLPSETGNLIVRPNNDAIAELKYQQLEFMIEHLRTQLKMSEATLRAQDVTIRAQECEISLLEMAASTRQLPEAASQVTQPDSSESEYLVRILGLKITKYKGKFYEIDIPELIQRVERLLGKGES